MSDNNTIEYPVFARGDFDAFLGLFANNLINLIMITSLCLMIGMPESIVFGKILPATAIAVVLGNFIFAFMAAQLAVNEERLDVTALPCGINTFTMLTFFSLIIIPVYSATQNPILAWKVAVFCAFISGICELIGTFFGEKILKITPRAAILSTLAGIALVFLSLQYIIQVWGNPLITFIPLALILLEYFSRSKLPYKIPAAVYAIVIGTVIAWLIGSMDSYKLTSSSKYISFYFPTFDLRIYSELVIKSAPYLSVAIPMGILGFLGSLQNIESAKIAGDKYNVSAVLAVNGVGTIIGSILGSPFPTTVYVGHPAWKKLGARGGYSIINALVVVFICFTGFIHFIIALIPMEVILPVLFWMGLIVAAQAFRETPSEHLPAIAVGILPMISAWTLALVRQFLSTNGECALAGLDNIIAEKIPQMKGIVAFSEGALFTSIFLAAIIVCLIERDYIEAYVWTIPLMVLSYLGIIHSAEFGLGKGAMLAAGYFLFGMVILLVYLYNKYYGDEY